MSAATESNVAADIPVAVIGIGCLFPRSNGLHEYWRLLLEGEDAISDVPPTHWSPRDYYDADPQRPDHTYCKRGGFLSPLVFDPTEFGIPPNSLAATDTSQLLGLVAAKMALDDAGYGGDRDFARDRTSVILGVTGTQELVVPLASRLGHPHWRRALRQAGVSPETCEAVICGIAESYVPWQENSFPGLLGNVVAGRICNRLNLGGTNCVVDAACASSMGAVHLALMELYTGRSDMVITGGVDTLNDIFMHMCFAKTRILSASGDIRPFSREADGTVLGEGVGLLVLKRLTDARKDGDRIYAVVRGIGSASDGRSQSIYAPRKEGQVHCLKSAYAAAGIDPATVSLVEAHGTGTRVGDKVEFEALKTVFASRSTQNDRCALGSVKSMIGHTKAAAGAAGLIKTVLALHHKVFPPTLKAEPPDPQLDIENSPFYLSTRSRPWFAEAGKPRRAGISAFGFGGSNFHAVLEESGPDKTAAAWDSAVEILALSADSHASLLEKLQRLQAEADAAYQNGHLPHLAANTRCEFDGTAAHRWLWAAEGRTLEDRRPAAVLADAVAALRQDATGERMAGAPFFYGRGPKPGGLAFLFPGQGSQYPDMGRDLACRFPEAFAVLETANACVEVERKLTDWIYPESPASQHPPDGLTDTRIAQPAIGAVSLAMLRVLQRFGVQPRACAGHSFGELTALAAAGGVPTDSFLALAAVRGRLMSAAGGRRPGGMTAVHAPLERIEALIADHGLDLVLANRNAPEQGVVSGSPAALERIEALCRKYGLRCVRLPVSAAFHSPRMADALKPFRDAAAQVAFQSPSIPVYANTTADTYPADAAETAAMLVDQLRSPVRFCEMIEAMHRDGMRSFVEIGPRNVLTALTSRILTGDRGVQTVALDASGGRRSGFFDLACLLCQLAALGHQPDLQHWGDSGRTMRKTRMQIRLNGANYVPEKTSAAPQPAPTRRPPAANDIDNFQAASPPDAAAAAVRKSEAPGIQPMQNHDRTTHTDDFIRQAMAAVQQGLQTMQSLQEQTARAHEKFLETQKEASRTLQMMMDGTRRLMDPASADFFPAEPRSAAALAGPEATAEPAAPPEQAAPAPAQAPVQASAPQPAAPPEVSEIRPAAETAAAGQGPPQPPESSRLLEVLLAVVGELTGYPVETIDPTMDIEADLGIDSIKRVEILSTLEERLPGLPSVPPEVLGRTKTLQEIVALLHPEPAAGALPPTVTRPSPEPLPSGEAPKTTAACPPVESAPLLTLMIAVVSELTGYPAETIDPDMDIEADLGIDSIKRVEILSAVEERMTKLPSIAPEVLGRMKTLNQIVEQFQSGTFENVPLSDCPATPSRAATEPAAPVRAVSAETVPPLERYRLRAVQRRAANAQGLTIPAGRKVFVTDDGDGFAEAIADSLGERGINTVLVSHDILRHRAQLPAAGGLVLVTGPETDLDTPYLKSLFELARSQAADLMESAAAGGALFAAVMRMDGSFGCSGNGIVNPWQGALAGLVKTAAWEWPGVRCRALDVSAGWSDIRAAAAATAAELLDTAAAEPLEVGLAAEHRRILELEPAPLPQHGPPAGSLTDGDVVLISGGGQGIAAEAACALAAVAKLKLVLLGRSPEPQAEPDWLIDLDTEAEIKKAILAHEFSGGSAPPREIEAAYRRYAAQRRIARTIFSIRQAGSEACYYRVDIRDPEAVSNTVARIRQEVGSVRSLIHAAGVLQDCLIVDKTPDQFETVFSTKADGLQALLAAVDPAGLKQLVLFSSVAGRAGNRGQADYAMANEALNKVARQLAADLPAVRVQSINWGPWDGGMVQPALRREFERRGIALIPVAQGCAHLLAEMALDAPEVEIVVGAVDLSAARSRTAVTQTDDRAPQRETSELALAFQRQIDTDSHPVLQSHVLGGRPVVPLALMAEWFGQSALHENPGLVLQGLDDMRVLKGIDLDGPAKTIRLLAGKARRSDDRYEARLEIRDESDRVLHGRARAVLADTLPPPPNYQRPAALGGNGDRRSAAELYEKILFHGPDLQGIRQIIHLSDRGMVAAIATAPAPAVWMKSPLRKHWLSDPLVLDAAFQMASVWCYETLGCVSLPSYCARYRQYRQGFPARGVSAILEIEDATARRMKGEFTFLDDEDRVVARITGYEAVVDASLNRAFKPDAGVETAASCGAAERARTTPRKQAATG